MIFTCKFWKMKMGSDNLRFPPPNTTTCMYSFYRAPMFFFYLSIIHIQMKFTGLMHWTTQLIAFWHNNILSIPTMVYIYIRKIQSGTSHTTSDEVSGHCFSNNSHLHTGIFSLPILFLPLSPLVNLGEN